MACKHLNIEKFMNKIIVVGHPQSGFERVHELLLASGMSQALPSRREGFTPAQISETLLKTHGVVPVRQVRNTDQLQQIAVAPVWQGLTLDLMLGNTEQTLWGWADTQAVYLLDYWKSQDPQIMFVLVYSEPQNVLTNHAVGDLQTEPETLQANVNAWVAYNAAMLSFHLRNPESSLLVHADQVQVSAAHFVEHLNARIRTPLQLSGVPLTQSDNLTAGDGAQTPSQTNAKAEDLTHRQAIVQAGLQDNALAVWLAQQVLQEHLETGELYAQLQAAASMPLRAQHSGQTLLSAQDLLLQRYRAWGVFVAQQISMQQLATLPGLQAELEAEKQKLAQLKQTGAKQVSNELEQENEMLLAQLHKVQEELERYYLERQKSQTSKQPKGRPYYGAADRVKQQLSYRLGSTMITQSRSVKGWLGMPFALNAEYKRFKQEQVERSNQKLPSLSQYRDAHEAEKVKKHLSYRLGARMIANSKSIGGWLALPWALYSEVKEFRKDLKND